ncbi:MAG: terminase small subunit [Selenomonadaceae bacterium]|nr:terminase small subunit [Selenomonadaceae bacterium]
MKLTARQERFIEEYLQSGNATKAYQSVFGCKAESARASAATLLRNVNVRARLAELQSAVMNEKILTAQEIQTLLSSIGRREVTETIYLPSGEQVQRPVSVRDSIMALQTLAKIQGLFVAKAEVELSGAMPVVIVDDI